MHRPHRHCSIQRRQHRRRWHALRSEPVFALHQARGRCIYLGGAHLQERSRGGGQDPAQDGGLKAKHGRGHAQQGAQRADGDEVDAVAQAAGGRAAAAGVQQRHHAVAAPRVVPLVQPGQGQEVRQLPEVQRGRQHACMQIPCQDALDTLHAR